MITIQDLGSHQEIMDAAMDRMPWCGETMDRAVEIQMYEMAINAQVEERMRRKAENQ